MDVRGPEMERVVLDRGILKIAHAVDPKALTDPIREVETILVVDGHGTVSPVSESGRRESRIT